MLGYARSSLAAAPAHSAAELFEPTIWYGIDRSGTVTINIIRAEMGQHVGTSLGRIVAEELEADWNKVKVVTVDSNSKWGTMVTGGSWSVWQSFPLLSQAGAAGRIALVEAGSQTARSSSAQICTARGGAVHTGARSILYGDIVARGDLRRTFTSRAARTALHDPRHAGQAPSDRTRHAGAGYSVEGQRPRPIRHRRGRGRDGIRAPEDSRRRATRVQGCFD